MLNQMLTIMPRNVPNTMRSFSDYMIRSRITMLAIQLQTQARRSICNTTVNRCQNLKYTSVLNAQNKTFIPIMPAIISLLSSRSLPFVIIQLQFNKISWFAELSNDGVRVNKLRSLNDCELLKLEGDTAKNIRPTRDYHVYNRTMFHCVRCSICERPMLSMRGDERQSQDETVSQVDR